MQKKTFDQVKPGDMIYYALRREIQDEQGKKAYQYLVGEYEVYDVSLVTHKEHTFSDRPYDYYTVDMKCYDKTFIVVPHDEMAKEIQKILYYDVWKSSEVDYSQIKFTISLSVEPENRDETHTSGIGTSLSFFTTKQEAYSDLYRYVLNAAHEAYKAMSNLMINERPFRQLPDVKEFQEIFDEEDKKLTDKLHTLYCK